MDRRGFLKSMLAAAMAPAVVRAESLMKIYVPPQEIFIPANSIVQGLEFGTNDFTFESWVKKPSDEGMLFGGDGQWKHIAQVYSNGRLVEYVDGVQVASGTLKRNFNLNVDMGNPKTVGIDFANGWIDDLRVTDGVARKIEVPDFAKKDSWFSVPFSRNSNAKFSG